MIFISFGHFLEFFYNRKSYLLRQAHVSMASAVGRPGRVKPDRGTHWSVTLVSFRLVLNLISYLTVLDQHVSDLLD